jgi:hypothetical protein
MDENQMREMEDRALQVVVSSFPFDVTARYELSVGGS